MALSDACSDFFEAVSKAAHELATAVHWYSAPDHPLGYGEEIDGLRRACAKVADAPYDPEAGAQLFHLAASVRMYLDTLPDAPELPQRQAEVNSLIQMLQASLDTEDASAVPSVIQNIVWETPFTKRAATQLQTILPKLGKAAYDMAVKVITDIGSETAKKMLGL